MKIAVPVHDEGLQVYTRVGRAPFFAIFNDRSFEGLRVNLHAASGTHEEEGSRAHHGGHGKKKRERTMEPYSKEEVEHHRKDLHNLQDIDVMLVRAVGPNMKEALELSGIKVVKTRKKDGERADELVKNFLDKNI
ncbi:NifB/NifX family molybdenum-iron cluster-binding protein [Hydrogenimonas cancrithermarum]|uniref:Dinitrogenase iron-molybdenum cofactor biosynthesis domain-containing protein n=1 Tax=Hydrogenimonas cancrithermarum TaxID=2993563 RepID=A0ABN6WRZ8_9BACT|nr:NifB/NifX family molybdenum-iron cluster-binding protein [Hydrogenimonas cancrithermarum]BDY11934.1 hypothetical protein HCR_02460 [Hydrogenimonas cancrithermarum]